MLKISDMGRVLSLEILLSEKRSTSRVASLCTSCPDFFPILHFFYSTFLNCYSCLNKTTDFVFARRRGIAMNYVFNIPTFGCFFRMCFMFLIVPWIGVESYC